MGTSCNLVPVLPHCRAGGLWWVQGPQEMKDRVVLGGR